MHVHLCQLSETIAQKCEVIFMILKPTQNRAVRDQLDRKPLFIYPQNLVFEKRF